MPLTNTHENQSQSLLVTIVAGAISSFAFGISVFAIGILWLLPIVKPVVPDAPVKPKRKDKSRRRSAPPVLQGRSTTLKSPIRLSSVNIKSSAVSESPRSPSRHVYFIDSPTRPSPGSKRYSVSTEDSTSRDDTVSSSPHIPPLSVSPDASPDSSSSTLNHVPPPTRTVATRVLDTCDESNESDSSKQSRPSSLSSRPSISLATRFPTKIKERWGKKSSSPVALIESTGDSSRKAFKPNVMSFSVDPLLLESDDTSSKASSIKSARRTSLGFTITPPWSASRTRTVSDLSSVTTASSPSTPRPSISTDLPTHTTPENNSTSFSLCNLPRTTKAQRRSSAPVRATVPRTQPYAYPYFAAPPVPGYQEPPRSMSNENSSHSGNESLPVSTKYAPEGRSEP